LGKAGLLIAAGIVSFYVAMRFSPSPENNDDTVVLTHTSNAAPRSHIAASSPGSSATSESRAPNPQSQDAAHTSFARLDPGMLQNPFGDLNLSARVDSEPEPGNAQVTPKKVWHKKVQPPPPPQPVLAMPIEPPPQPQPVAPPLPFTVLGSMQSTGLTEGQTVAFLKYQNKVIAAHTGDVIDAQYRISKIMDDRVEFLYLPLGKPQTLNIVH
jgi:outer membrane biosynthesis protein TonB